MNSIQQLQKQLLEENLDQIIVTDPASIDYYTDQLFEVGERFIGLLIPQSGQPTLLLNKLFTAKPTSLFEVQYYYDSDPLFEILEHLIDHKPTGIDGHCPSSILFRLNTLFDHRQFYDASPWIDRQRAIKSSLEQQKMIEASAHNDRAMAKVRKLLIEGISEIELSDAIKAIQSEDGAQGISFEPIVSINDHIADPHALPTSRCLKQGDAIVVDMGGIVNGYCSDMTRTFYLGEHPYRSLYNIVLEANRAAIATVKAGATFAEVDQAARRIITEAGYGQYFTHRTGHGIGKSVHEPYDVSSSNHAVIETGMVFSIEPGIYLPGKSGVRIEDLVIATDEGCIVLNHYPKNDNDL